MKETTSSGSSMVRGTQVVLVLHTPREKCWGILDEINQIYLQLIVKQLAGTVTAILPDVGRADTLAKVVGCCASPFFHGSAFCRR
jgi:hypothetical protein